MHQATSPRVDRSDGVSACLLTLLVHTIVASDSTVGSLTLDSLAVGSDQNRGHQSERSKALSNNVGLNITVVVFACPHEAAFALQALGDHVVNQTMCVGDVLGVHHRFVFLTAGSLSELI